MENNEKYEIDYEQAIPLIFDALMNKAGDELLLLNELMVFQEKASSINTYLPIITTNVDKISTKDKLALFKDFNELFDMCEQLIEKYDLKI